MATEQHHYNDLTERQSLCLGHQVLGMVMLHDDFDPDWLPGEEPHGTLTFALPTLPTDEELYQQELIEEFNDIHFQALQALKNWSSLTLPQKDTVLKNLLKWALWKEGFLKFGVL